jgi:hypothetical protein
MVRLFCSFLAAQNLIKIIRDVQLANNKCNNEIVFVGCCEKITPLWFSRNVKIRLE